MAKLLSILTLLAVSLCGASYGQSHSVPPKDAKPIHDAKVSIVLSHDAKGRALLKVFFYGSQDEIRYADVDVRALDDLGEEIAVTQGDRKPAYLNCGFGKYRGDAWLGFYHPDAEEARIAKIILDWKGDEVVFAPPPRAKYLTFKELHGGRVSITIKSWPDDGPKVLDVLFKGIRETEIKYAQIALSAFDDHGAKIPTLRFPLESDSYISESQHDGVFIGMYKIAGDATAISRVTMKWDDEEVDFPAADLVPH